jgi:hypothetical protein
LQALFLEKFADGWAAISLRGPRDIAGWSIVGGAVVMAVDGRADARA